MSATQGRSNPWSAGQTHRRLVAGEVIRGGGARDCFSGDQTNGGAHPRVAGARARRVVLSALPEMAQNNVGDGKCGGRRSSIEQIDGSGHGWSHGWARWTRGASVSSVVSLDVCLQGHSHGGDKANGEELSAPMATVVRRCG